MLAFYTRMNLRLRESTGHPARKGLPELMGITHVKASVFNLSDPAQRLEIKFLVDSGVVYTVIPTRTLELLGITPHRERIFTLADGPPLAARSGTPDSLLLRRREPQLWSSDRTILRPCSVSPRLRNSDSARTRCIRNWSQSRFRSSSASLCAPDRRISPPRSPRPQRHASLNNPLPDPDQNGPDRLLDHLAVRT